MIRILDPSVIVNLTMSETILTTSPTINLIYIAHCEPSRVHKPAGHEYV